MCGTQPQKTVPVIAHQITDRDNTVRSAALNAMVVVYGNTGEGVYKFTSQVRVIVYGKCFLESSQRYPTIPLPNLVSFPGSSVLF